jgi:hypothetical protein
MRYKNLHFMLIFFLVVALVTVINCGRKEQPKQKEASKMKKAEKEVPVIKNFEDIKTVKKQIAKLARVKITCDPSTLNDNEKKALLLMVKAAQRMDRIFLRQVYNKNEQIRKELLKKRKENEEYRILWRYFNINFGPFDRLAVNKPFINRDENKSKGANFYPPDMTKEEFEAHIKENPDDEKVFTSNFTRIRREKGKLVAVPYSQAYEKLLKAAAKLLKAAAQLINNPSLKKYLNSRAEAFSSDDYYQSDIDWVDLKDHKIELVIGPYEVYEDRLFGYKAAFEAFVTLVDKEETAKIAKISLYVGELEKNLPMDDIYKKTLKRGESSPISIANEVFAAGDTKAGIQTIAFNLPNDERVREEKGSKQVMLKNICKAKFDKCLIPITKEVLAEADKSLVSFDSFFNHILMHEISHALGPGIIEKNGKKTTVNKELKELYSVLEETKADILGMWNSQFLMDKGVLPNELEKNLYITYLGSMFRSMRFGLDQAHGGANAIEINYILEKQGFLYDEATGRFRVNPDPQKVKDAVKQLCQEILEIHALGDYDRAKQFIDKYRHISPQVEKAIAKVTHVPTDIQPVYTILKELRKKENNF